ncbi:hypothetical protein B296_00056790 [Ensete ventricosum]|uniref:Uncharacterized protein n=1 Tax=Ensete ventricosum TaxID=4639 RepID=A0A426XTV1_ENSVE|nr:hypothetical protein B296_00056790 [Ensete ventricosum]
MLPLRKETKGCQEKQGRARRGKMEEKQKGLFIVEIRMTVLPPNNDAYRESSVHVSIQDVRKRILYRIALRRIKIRDRKLSFLVEQRSDDAPKDEGLNIWQHRKKQWQDYLQIPKHVLLLTKQDAGGTVATNQHKLSATLRTAFWFRTQAEPWLVLRWLRRRRSC